VLVIALSPRHAVSLPLYARQTGQPCATCHTAFLELTPFGRRFKLGGYTLGGGDWTGPPFAVMLQAPTFTHTEAGQEGGAAPHFGTNNNFALQQVSLFTGGRITDNLGAFIQGTYNGVARRFGWDNTDIRYADSVNLGGHNLLWGVTANNNPTVQDVWNTIPAWSFPYISSALAPMPSARTFIDQVYAQQVIGVSAYTFLDDMLYLEFGGYRPLSTNTQLVLGIDTTGQSPISGVAPYWRVAFESTFANIRGKSVPLGSHRRWYRCGCPVQAPIPSPTSGSTPNINISVIRTRSQSVPPGSTRTITPAPARRSGSPTIPTTRCDP
jgi:hypothetical protein